MKNKVKVEDITNNEVGSLLEIRNVFKKYNEVIIDEGWDLYENGEKMKELDIASHMALNPGVEYKDSMNIIGINPAFNAKTKKFEFYIASTNDLNILLSLISLVNEPINIHSLSDSFNNNEIIKWCKDHTLPSVKKDEDLKLCNTEKNKFLYSSMPLDSFYREVTIIYLLFNTWRFLNSEDFNKAKKYATKLRELTLGGKAKEINDNDDINIILTAYIDLEMKSIYARFTNFGSNKLFLDTDNLFSMVYFQLSNLMTKPIESRKHLKECSNCHRLYWGHGNSRYCDNCDRRTVFSREHRGIKEG